MVKRERKEEVRSCECIKTPETERVYYLPEPVDLLAVFGIMPIDGVLLPVIQINFLHPTQHELEQETITHH